MSPKSKDPVEPAAPVEPVVAEPAAPVARPFMSEGIRHELEVLGRAGDPVTGGRFERDKETGKITYTDRAGNVTELD